MVSTNPSVMRAFEENKEKDETAITKPAPGTSNISLPKLIFLKNLYPVYLLDALESENIIKYVKTGIQVTKDDSQFSQKKFNDQVIKMSKEITYCPFLLGYNPALTNAFRHDARIQKILRDKDAYIITSKKYEKFKTDILEKYKGLEDIDENDLPVDQSFSFLVSCTEPVEKIKDILLNGEPKGTVIGDDTDEPERLIKFRKEVKVKQSFYEPPEVNATYIKELINKYEKRISIVPKVIQNNGNFCLFFGLTCFSDAFILDSVKTELENSYYFEKKKDLNHFEFIYYKKVLYPKFTNLYISLNLEVRFNDKKEINWHELFNKDYYVAELAIKGLKKDVEKLYLILKNELKDLREEKVQVKTKIGHEVYKDFKNFMTNLVCTLERDLDDIVFSNHIISQTRRDEKPSEKFIIIFVLGSKNKNLKEAVEKIEELLAEITYDFCETPMESISRQMGFPKLEDVENAFELKFREADQKGENRNPTYVCGRKKDIETLNIFLRLGYFEDSHLENMTYSRILQKEKDFDRKNREDQVSFKFHPNKPQIMLSGDKDAMSNFQQVITRNIERLKQETVYCSIDKDTAYWITKPVNHRILRFLERKYRVYFIELPFHDQKVGIVENVPSHEEVMEHLATFVFGTRIEKEIELTNDNLWSNNELLAKAKREGIELDKKKDSVILKGYSKKVQDLAGEIQLQQGVEGSRNQLMYWENRDKSYKRYERHERDDRDEREDRDVKTLITRIHVRENSDEFKTISSLFHDTMKIARIRNLWRIQNQWLKDRFDKALALSSKNGETKKPLFYGSDKVDPAEIYKDLEIGFDHNFSNSEEKDGFYFSRDAKVAHELHKHTVGSNTYQMIFAYVFGGGDQFYTSKSANIKEYFIEDGSRCYPHYLIEYETPS